MIDNINAGTAAQWLNQRGIAQGGGLIEWGNVTTVTRLITFDMLYLH